ncbi:2'-5' RNA ligase family protein [Deinococcus sp. KSM4-11]|uniref:2'-5' RNA ligase family protein n=1 Tax=Deinococcus sp. KSM4-11 TaxID=2568654 RepID=UPI0010A39EF8|nr:2'-5' RNA ligase family protein [Deinococcus sp. KSM4-11]THF86535.1 2'-5' RNA ligase family protein [Deinococcus sp. KSM4-11]
MTPTFLLALLPPPELAARVQAFRTAHALRDAAGVSHITVKARSGLDADLAWVPVAREVVAAHPPLMLTIGGPRVFGNGSALYLRVDSPDAVRLHVALLDALQPAQRFGFEGPHLTLHLSVALARRGVDLLALLADARREFADLEAAPLTFTAHAVAFMRKPGPDGVYVPLEAWPLAGR